MPDYSGNVGQIDSANKSDIPDDFGRSDWQGNICPHVFLKGDLFSGGFFAEARDVLDVLRVASLGQRVLATPKGLSSLFGIESRNVGKRLLGLQSLLSVSGDGWVREVVVSDLLICAISHGATSDLALSVAYGWKMPNGPVSHWRAASLPSKVRKQVVERDGKVCAYCGATEGKFHVDHIHPIAKGGTDDLENLTVSCAACNLSKSDKTVEQWRASQR